MGALHIQSTKQEFFTSRCLLGFGVQSAKRAEWLAATAAVVDAGIAIRWNAEEPIGGAFTAVAGIFASFVERVRVNAPEALVAFAPELFQIWPGLRADARLASLPNLEDIALGGTKRRLHRDSEQLFRIIHALASFIEKGLQELDISAPLVVVCDNIDAADRLSIAALVHMAHRLPNRFVLIAALEQEWLDDPASLGRPWIWGDDALCNSSQTDPALESIREHASLLQNLIELPGTKTFQVQGGDESETARSGGLNLALASLGANAETIIAIVGGREGAKEIGYSHLTRRNRREILASLPLEKRRVLHRDILGLAVKVAGPSETTSAWRAIQALRAGEHEIGVRAAQDALNAGFGFSMNFELMLACGNEALLYATGQHAVALRLMLALVRQYLGHVKKSADEFKALLNECVDPVLFAQISFYLGLTLSKRLGSIDEGLNCIETGLLRVGPVLNDNWQAALEFGWLCNARAFCLWRLGRAQEAQQAVGKALEVVANYENPQIANLRVNLINNLSVLCETSKNYEDALKVWESLQPLSDIVTGGRFSKSYQYRRGWLLLKLGKCRDALTAYEGSYSIAREVRDLFHMDIISRACGYVSIVCRDYAGAQNWYEINRSLRSDLGDRVNTARSWFTMALLAEVQDQNEEAKELARRALTLANEHGRAELASAINGQLEMIGRRTSQEALEVGLDNAQLGFEKPKMKLTTPFAIANLVPDGYLKSAHLTLSPEEVGA
jgi:tetratricopeptide (TPR) repeat protein